MPNVLILDTCIFSDDAPIVVEVIVIRKEVRDDIAKEVEKDAGF